MVVFIDESQDAERFVLGAVTAPDLISLHDTLGDMRKAARHWGIMISEFHETALYKEHPRLLTRSLKLLVEAPKRPKRSPAPRPDVDLFAVYYRKSAPEQLQFPFDRLLAVYQEAFSAILWALPSQEREVVIVCDKFEKCWMIEGALQSQLERRFKGTVRFGESQQEKPLQLADMEAGTVRRHLAHDPNEGRFGILAPMMKYIREVQVPRA